MSKLRNVGKQLGDLVDGERDDRYDHEATESRMAGAVRALATKMAERPVATAYLLIVVAVVVIVLAFLALT